MAKVETWQEVKARLADLGVSPARFMRRCDMSESTFFKGVQNGSVLQPSTASVVNRVLREIAEGKEAAA